MGGEWSKTTIGELCKKVATGGTPLTSNSAFYENATIPWLKTKEVNFCRIYETENKVSELALLETSIKLVPKNSVIVAMYGQGDTAGRVAINKIPLTTNQACCNLVIDESKADYRFVYFYLMNSYEELVRRKTGSAQPNLNTNIVKSFEIRVPSLENQIQIGDILSSLDDKIELNNQTNTTLESMSQALFKSWFVDFDPVIDNAIACGNPIPDELSDRAERRRALKQNPDSHFQPLPTEIQQLFPSSFVLTDEMGWVPEGWKLATLGKICELSGGQIQTGPFGSQLHASDYVDHGTPVVMPKDLQNRRINESTTAKINAENAARLSRHRMKIGDIVFSRRGDVEKHALIGAHEENWICGTGCLLVRPGSEWVSPSYISFSLDQAVTKAWLTQHAVGATMPNLNTGILSEVPVTLPANKILNFFEILVGTTEKQISANNAVAESLTKIRDELLPKLLSGQIQIPEAEALLNDTLCTTMHPN